MEKKMSTTTEMLCSDIPNEFQLYLQQVMDLNYDEKPNYEYLRGHFRSLTKKLVKVIVEGLTI